MEDYHITLQETNNPAILKFEANHFLVKQNYEFKNIDEERFDIVEWNDVKDEVAQQLVEYLNAGQAVVLEESVAKKEAITVYAEVTPNPGVMKFVANKMIVPSIFEFKNIDEAANSDLAKQLFHFPFVKEVFFDQNYVSVTKYDVAEWEEITMELREFIRDFLADGKTVVSESAPKQSTQNSVDEQQETVYDDTSSQIIAILEEYVKPAVASDGGNIMFQSYEEDSKTVNVVLQGACSGCPSSTFTLKNGIETMLKNMLGDKVNEVVALNG